jgi:SAM-dependent methyltransferase
MPARCNAAACISASWEICKYDTYRKPISILTALPNAPDLLGNNNLYMQCTLCNNILTDKKDGSYYICGTCGAYVKDIKFYLSAEDEKKRYMEHNNDVNDPGYQKFTSPITNAVLKRFMPNHLGLDYGCGTGPVISEMLRANDYKITLYDPFFYPGSSYLNCRYDYIVCCEVIEHFYKPKEEIEKLLGILKPGGYLYIMTHLYDTSINFKNWYYRNDPTHVFILAEPTVKYIAGKYQLHIEALTDRLIVFSKIE